MLTSINRNFVRRNVFVQLDALSSSASSDMLCINSRQAEIPGFSSNDVDFILECLCVSLPSHFYRNVTTLRSGLCCHNSVCLSDVCRLSSVALVHPTQAVEAFGNISSPLCTLAIQLACL